MEPSETTLPDREGTHHGLAYALRLPDPARIAPPWAGIVVIHGAGSRKENHADFARLATATGWAALTFDLPGHGESGGEMSGHAIGAVIEMVRFLGQHESVDGERVALRGSSLGGFLAITAAARGPDVAGVIAICPAPPEHLARGVRSRELDMRIGDPIDLEAWLAGQDLGEAVERIAGRPLILMHAEGDIQIPSEHTADLFERAGEPRKLVIVPGGTPRSVQHDPELQGLGLIWLEGQLASR
jgi:fermentation-respiration switch protein FrsA (DUF1100 family)